MSIMKQCLMRHKSANWRPNLHIRLHLPHALEMAGSLIVWICMNIAPIGEGNGIPLRYSCLENPMDGEAWCRLQSMSCKESDMTKWLHFHFQLWIRHGKIFIIAFFKALWLYNYYGFFLMKVDYMVTQCIWGRFCPLLPTLLNVLTSHNMNLIPWDVCLWPWSLTLQYRQSWSVSDVLSKEEIHLMTYVETILSITFICQQYKLKVVSLCMI